MGCGRGYWLCFFLFFSRLAKYEAGTGLRLKSRGTQTLLGLILRQHESGFWIEQHRGFISTTRIPERGLSSTLSGVVARLSDAAHASHRDLTPRSSMLLPTCSSPATQRAPEPLDAAVQRHPGGPSVLQYTSTLEGLLASRVVRVMLAEDFRGASAARKRAVKSGWCERVWTTADALVHHIGTGTHHSEICSLHWRCGSSLFIVGEI